MLRRQLKFNLKGTRDYVKGVDLIQAFLDALPDYVSVDEICRVSIFMRRFTRRQCILFISEPGETFTKSDQVIADFHVTLKERKFSAWLEETREDVQDRIEFEDPPYSSRLSSDRMSIFCLGTESKKIAPLLDLGKELHRSHFSFDNPGKWVLISFELLGGFFSGNTGQYSIKFRPQKHQNHVKYELYNQQEMVGNAYGILHAPV